MYINFDSFIQSFFQAEDNQTAEEFFQPEVYFQNIAGFGDKVTSFLTEKCQEALTVALSKLELKCSDGRAISEVIMENTCLWVIADSFYGLKNKIEESDDYNPDLTHKYSVAFIKKLMNTLKENNSLIEEALLQEEEL